MLIGVAKSAIRSALKRFLPEPPLTLEWIKRPAKSWLVENLPASSIRLVETVEQRQFEQTSKRINDLGAQPLWDGYQATYDNDANIPWATAAPQRLPDQVRSQPQMGRFFCWLVERRKPDLVVEIGTAFGVSAMYWAHGLQRAGQGRLLTFEPNPVWHKIAADHLRIFADFVKPICGTFEDEIDAQARGQAISISFVDAIHTSRFVDSQVSRLLERSAPNALIVLDDITFSSDMQACWLRWANDPRVQASVAVDQRVGILEF
ncbi:MAG: class I SAM-dependent methyltransferase [Afipia sp.]|nr:class I SAM-dependent methyltransferase [Afipia sp.]